MKLKKGDLVKVITGKDKGKEGKVISIITRTDRVIVEGANLVKRHVKPNKKVQKGGIIEKEASMHVSNVKVISSGE